MDTQNGCKWGAKGKEEFETPSIAGEGALSIDLQRPGKFFIINN
jgi:hypothetical protein